MSAPTEDTTFQVKLDFPDAKAREDFETAFRAWLKEYQQRVTIHRALGAALDDAGVEGDDSVGFLFRRIVYGSDGSTSSTYINLIWRHHRAPGRRATVAE